MAAIEKVLSGIKNAKVQAAVEGLARPQTRDAFELGRLCGIQIGISLAEKLIEEALKEDDQPSTKTNASQRIRRG